LKINKRDHEEALVYIAEREKALHDKVAQDRVVAEQRLQDEIDGIRIAGIVDDYDREVASLKLKLQQKTLALFQEFGVTEHSEQLVLQMKQAYADQFIRWFIDRNQKMYEELTRIHDKLLHEEDEQRAAEGKAVLDRQLREFEAHEKEIQSLIQHFGRSKGSTGILDVNELDATNARLKALGISVQTVESRFGGASRNLQQFNEKIKVFELIQNGHPFQAMALEAKLLADSLRDSQTDAERWSSFLTNAVNQMGSNIEQGFEGLVNGTMTFAQLMKKIIFDLIASMAEQWGAYYLALGIADIFWNPAKGAAELAAGGALMALAGGAPCAWRRGQQQRRKRGCRRRRRIGGERWH
jgi:hypothetical protein